MKSRMVFLALVLLFLNVAFFLVVVLPARRAVLVHAATLEDIHAQKRILRQEQRYQEILSSLHKRMEQFRNRIPPQGAILAMIRRVTDQAQRLDVYIPSVRYQPREVEGEDLVKLTVQMEVEGRYAGIRRFLYDIEGLQDPLIIEKVVLTSQGPTGRIKLRLQMAAYFLAETVSTVHVPMQEKQIGVRG